MFLDAGFRLIARRGPMGKDLVLGPINPAHAPTARTECGVSSHNGGNADGAGYDKAGRGWRECDCRIVSWHDDYSGINEEDLNIGPGGNSEVGTASEITKVRNGAT